MQQRQEMPQQLVDEVQETYRLLNMFLEKTRYIADNHATVADFSVITTVEVADLFVPIDADKYSKLSAWVKSIKGLPCYQVNIPGFELFKIMVKEMTKQN